MPIILFLRHSPIPILIWLWRGAFTATKNLSLLSGRKNQMENILMKGHFGDINQETFVLITIIKILCY